MPALSLSDMELWKYLGAQKARASADNALATATLVAPNLKFRLRMIKVDASYSNASTTGLLQLKSGTTVIDEKYIHGAGALDSADWGDPALNLNEAMSVELAASGTGGIIGKVSVSGFKHPDG